MTSSTSKTFRRATALLLLMFCGCGGEENVRPPLHPVQGTLTINGKPAAGALLVFHPTQKENFDSRGSRPRAKVGEDGTFHITTYQDGDGAPVGDYHVGILWFDNPDSDNAWDKLGNRYANPEATDISISVEEGENQLAPIEIKNARVLNRPVRRQNAPDFDQVD